ncbi:MAG: Gfo/Idh/MocA family protein [Verrucomicrobiales bacterium]
MNENEKTGKVRWGFLGAAAIARKNWAALRHSGNGELRAVGSRNRERAEDFVREGQLSVPFVTSPTAVEGYEAILADEEIEAVYVPLPTALRKEWVIKAAQAGKHVLCEKPCAVSLRDLEEMTEACERHGVQFMDGVMFMHSRRLETLREVVAKGRELGELRRLDSGFSFYAEEEFRENIRMSAELEPGGCVGDLGWYNIRMSLALMDYEMPVAVRGDLLEEREGVPVAFQGDLRFADGVTASFYCSFTAALQAWFRVAGTEGTAILDDFVIPFYGCESRFKLLRAHSLNEACDFKMERHERVVSREEYSTNHGTSQEARLFRHFNRLVRSGEREEFWPEVSRQTQRVMDALLDSARQGGGWRDLA